MKMQLKTRLKRLEQEYFPKAKSNSYSMGEIMFSLAFHQVYEGRQDSAPKILLREYNRRFRWD